MQCEYSLIINKVFANKRVPKAMQNEISESLLDRLWELDDGYQTDDQLLLLVSNTYDNHLINILSRQMCESQAEYSKSGSDYIKNITDMIFYKTLLSSLTPMHIDILWMHMSGFNSEDIGIRYGTSKEWAMLAVSDAFYDFKSLVEEASRE
jgi:hypothetical protein